MNLSRLQSEVSKGTYIFKRPLTFSNCATQDKYIIYASCQHCLKGVQPDGTCFYCPVQQCVRFTLRVLLSDWEAGEVWAAIFDELSIKVLGINANTYTGMTPDADGFASLSLIRGTRVMVTIKKRIKDTYVNYTVSELKLVGS